MAKVENLFAYGPWCQGGCQFRFLEPYIESLRDAYLIGRCLRTDLGYPVYLEDGTDRVTGQVVTLRGPEVLWQLLEEFHGVHPNEPTLGLFLRRQKEAIDVATGLMTPVLVYTVSANRRGPGWTAVPAGDWRATPQPVPLPDRMSDRQKAYIKRLGQTTSREIVPIDLELYRELIKLQLIVDKGRRLALSPLGKDVLRYL